MPKSLSIRLPEELSGKLEDLCNELDRSKSFIVKKALEEYVLQYSDYLIAIERLKDKNDEILSSEEMRDKLGL